MRVLVTGAAGYFGRQIVPALLDDPAIEAVVALDRVELPVTHPKLTGIRRDLVAGSAEAELDAVDAVIHLAFRVERAPGEDVAAVNVAAHQRFLRAAVARPITLVVVSSVAAYGLRPEAGDRLGEDAPPAPGRGFYYAEHKIAAERLLAELAPTGAARVVVVRPSAVGGPTVDPRRALQYKGRLHLLANTGHVPRVQILHEADLGPAFRALLAAPAGLYNLAPDDDLPEPEAARLAGQVPLVVPRWLYAAACDATWRLGLNGLDAAWARMLDYPSIVVDNAKLKALGWRPTRTTRDAILDLVAAVRGREAAR